MTPPTNTTVAIIGPDPMKTFEEWVKIVKFDVGRGGLEE
jgi:hypothetical protein